MGKGKAVSRSIGFRSLEERGNVRKMYLGSISVFCSIVFPFLILFLMSLLLYAKHQTMQTSIRNDLDTAGFSVLAEYDKSWVREYGLYVIPKSEIEEDVAYYMEKNRVHSWGSYQVEEITVTHTNSLAERMELQEQIRMFMNERGFLEIIEEIGSMILALQAIKDQIN